MCAQSSVDRSVYIGIDLGKNIWPLFNRLPTVDRQFTIESLLLIPQGRPGRSIYLAPGYSSYAASAQSGSFRSHTFNGRGGFIKTGIEQRGRRFSQGIGLIASIWQEKGFFSFQGEYFGPYQQNFPTLRRFTTGAEVYVCYFLPLGKQFDLRFQYRLGAALPPKDHSLRPRPLFIPGMGLAVGEKLPVSTGFTIQFLYHKLRPQSPE